MGIKTDKIYNLDQAATTQVMPEAIETMEKYMKDDYYNPSAVYSVADKVHTDLEHARAEFAEIFGVSHEEIIFTSGGSESNCLAILGAILRGCYGSFVTTNIEHKSIMKLYDNLDHRSYVNVSMVSVDKNGIVSASAINNAYWHDDDLICSVQYVNNEIGVVQDIVGISENVRKTAKQAGIKNVLFHSDGTQAIGHVPIEQVKRVIQAVDTFTISGHKFGAPKGVGILIKKKHVKLTPIIFGTQNFGVRGGTENVPAIMAMLTALKITLKNSTDENVWKNFAVREKLVHGINKITPIELTVSKNVTVAPNILSVRFVDECISGEALIGFLSALGVYCSLGSACNAHQGGKSHVLEALGVADRDALRTVRITFQDCLTDYDIKEIISRFEIAINAIKKTISG